MNNYSHSLDGFLLYRFCTISRDMRAIVARDVLAPHGLDLRDWFVLLAVGELELASQRQAVLHTDLDKVAVNRASARLKKARLITMRASRADGRSRLMQLTDKGREFHLSSCSAIATIEREIMSELAVEETGLLSRMLSRLDGAVRQRERRRSSAGTTAGESSASCQTEPADPELVAP